MHNAAEDGATLAEGAASRVEAVGAVPPAADVVSRAEEAGVASRVVVVDGVLRTDGIFRAVDGAFPADATLCSHGVASTAVVGAASPSGLATACLMVMDTMATPRMLTAIIMTRMPTVRYTLATPRDSMINGATGITTPAATGIRGVLL